MSKEIWKFQEYITDTIKFITRGKPEILSVKGRKGFPAGVNIWAIIDHDAEFYETTLAVRGTGHPLDGTEGKHLETIVTDVGLVFHIFEVNGG